MKNMDIYEQVREVPEEAKKTIKGGRLKGFTDINPMWRIQTLTEQFGPCGIGWYFEVEAKWIDKAENNEAIANVLINLYIKTFNEKIGLDEWSKPIVGIGGSKFISNEGNGTYTSDECFKMATTDAISVACKNLGFGADVYWSQGRTKYDAPAAYPSRTEMLKVVKEHYPDEATLKPLLDTFKIKKIEQATDAQLMAVFNKYSK